MKIIAASENDIDELAHVEISSKLDSIPGCIEPVEVDLLSRLQRWQTYFAALSPQTSKPERLVLKATNDEGKIAGYIAGHLTTRYNMDAEIQSFYMLRSEQQKGVGTKLLFAFTQWLLQQNAASLCVGIRPSNKYKAFYLKYGGQYLNEHWIFWHDVPALATRLASGKLPKD